MRELRVTASRKRLYTQALIRLKIPSEVHMGLPKVLTMSLAILFIVGCSTPEPPPPPKKTVFDPLTQQLDRARGVQNTIDASADTTRKAVDSQERGDSSP